MSLVPGIPNPYLEALVVGLLYGTVFCTSSCLPYLASYIAGIGADFRKGVTTTVIYNVGRVTAYALLGIMIGTLSALFRFTLDESALSTFQQYSSYGFSMVTIIIGITILLKTRSASQNCNPECAKKVESQKIWGRFDLRALSLGFSRGLIVCPPLAALLLYSVPFGAPIDSFVVAVLFGLGTSLSPMLLLGGVTGWLFNKAPLFRRWLSIAGGGVLVMLGTLTLLSTIFF
jgi:cytochrome c-type biogenesis protein